MARGCARPVISWKDIVKQKGKFFQEKQKDPIDCQAGVHRPLLP
jgi:hypothetical protein